MVGVCYAKKALQFKSHELNQYHISTDMLFLIAISAIAGDGNFCNTPSCFKVLSGGLECHHNERVCDRVGDDDEDIARSVGMTCDSWPLYNGGYPLSAVDPKTTNAKQACRVRSNGLCVQWVTFDDGILEFTNCVDPQGSYCQSWAGEQMRVQKCADGGCDVLFKEIGCLCGKPGEELKYVKVECTDVRGGLCNSWVRDVNGVEAERANCRTFDSYGCTQWVSTLSAELEIGVSDCVTKPNGMVDCVVQRHALVYPNLAWSGVVLFIYAAGTIALRDCSLLVRFHLFGGTMLINVVFIWLGGVGELVIALAGCIVILLVWVLSQRPPAETRGDAIELIPV